MVYSVIIPCSTNTSLPNKGQYMHIIGEGGKYILTKRNDPKYNVLGFFKNCSWHYLMFYFTTDCNTSAQIKHLLTNSIQDTPLFPPLCLNPMVYIPLYFFIVFCMIDPKYLNHVTCGKVWFLFFTSALSYDWCTC